MADTQPAPEPKKSDLGTRAASAVVMVAVAGTALWLGGWWWTVFVAATAGIAFVEFVGLIRKIGVGKLGLVASMIGGVGYIGAAAYSLVMLHGDPVLYVVVTVIVTDTAAYFAGRSIGGPKIAPKISPSKTWSGLLGGMIAAGAWLSVAGVMGAYTMADQGPLSPEIQLGALTWTGFKMFLIGSALAVAAQAGDLFESWLKRRAGVKDSSNLIPGHGGVFDRIDGLLPVSIIFGLFAMAVQ